jgi:Hsp20/alpha crystallin family
VLSPSEPYKSSDRDVELTVTDGMLHMPEGVVESDIKASYKDGILEIRIPMSRAVAKPETTKIQIKRG